jgi:hypothetical protein
MVSCYEGTDAVSGNILLGVIHKVKVKLSLCFTEHHAMKAFWGSGGIAPHILLPWH